MTVSQTGPSLRFNRAEAAGSIVLAADSIMPLPAHPRPGHVDRLGRPSRVLPEAYAPLVTHPLAPPADADRTCIYHGTATVPGDSHAFVHTLWVAHDTLDVFCGAAGGTAAEALGAISAGVQNAHTCTPLVQPAAGLYTELGWGFMPGTGRESVVADGHASPMPFRRNPELSDELAPHLSRVFGMCATVAHAILPADVLDDHLQPWHACPADIAEALQYPPRLPGAPPLLSHQVALRGVDESGGPAESQQRCQEAVADLHVDRNDGGGPLLGTVAIYGCAACPAPLLAEARARLEHRDMVVFPRTDGGRGVRVRVLVPGWICAVYMKTRTCLHGGVSAVPPRENSGAPVPPLALPAGVQPPVRIITYPLRPVETLMRNLQHDSAAAQTVRDRLSL